MGGKKYFRAGQATEDNMAHVYCMLDTQGYKHTHSEYVMHITVPLLHERASILRYTYIARHVNFSFIRMCLG